MENNFSLLSLFTGDWMTVFVSIVLVVFSVMSWTIIVEKIRERWECLCYNKS